MLLFRQDAPYLIPLLHQAPFWVRRGKGDKERGKKETSPLARATLSYWLCLAAGSLPLQFPFDLIPLL